MLTVIQKKATFTVYRVVVSHPTRVFLSCAVFLYPNRSIYNCLYLAMRVWEWCKLMVMRRKNVLSANWSVCVYMCQIPRPTPSSPPLCPHAMTRKLISIYDASCHCVNVTMPLPQYSCKKWMSLLYLTIPASHNSEAFGHFYLTWRATKLSLLIKRVTFRIFLLKIPKLRLWCWKLVTNATRPCQLLVEKPEMFPFNQSVTQ